MKKKPTTTAIENRFRIAIFGSARIKKGQQRYNLIYNLAKEIAEQGIDIVTGGGPGLMDAASRGHHAGRKNKNIYTVGLTIHLPKEQKQSYHLDVKKDFHKFSKRLDNFIHLSNVVVVAPGGVGTMLELMYVWQLVQVKYSCRIPIILFGDIWKDFIKWIKNGPLKNKFLDEEDLELLYLAKNSDEAMKLIKLSYEEYKKGSKNICLNIRKYRIK
ncbi:MAG: LOG family protein [Nanoarchaeota archaeon]|nr:LOG family protein [Nanoarchaeota archaeon]